MPGALICMPIALKDLVGEQLGLTSGLICGQLQHLLSRRVLHSARAGRPASMPGSSNSSAADAANPCLAHSTASR